jgi:hypothetical protein
MLGGVDREPDALGGLALDAALQHLEARVEDLVEERALAGALRPDDAHQVVVALQVLQLWQLHDVEGFRPASAANVLEFRLVVHQVELFSHL